MPARCRRSWLPPTISGSSGVPRRTYIAPTPFGPCILCALIEHRWQPNRRTSNSTLPAPCTASIWKNAPASAAIFADLFDRLQHAGLVIRQHHADEPCRGPQRPPNLLGIDQSVGARRNKRHLRAAFRHALRRAQHCRVLNRRRNQVIACAHQAEDRRVVPLGAAGVEHHFRFAAMEETAQGSRAPGPQPFAPAVLQNESTTRCRTAPSNTGASPPSPQEAEAWWRWHRNRRGASGKHSYFKLYGESRCGANRAAEPARFGDFRAGSRGAWPIRMRVAHITYFGVSPHE